MTEPLRKYRSSDVPEYSSYPAEPDRPLAEVEVVGFTAIREFDAMPEVAQKPYDDQGRKIGIALGRLANRLEELFAPIRAEVGEKIGQLEDDVEIARGAAQNAYAEAQNKITDVARRSVNEVRARAAELQHKASQTVDEYPVHTLAAVGVAGIALGVGLRVWRERRG